MTHWTPDESWKGSYDDWKTTDPRDYEPEERKEEDPDDARDRAIEDVRHREMFPDAPDDDISF